MFLKRVLFFVIVAGSIMFILNIMLSLLQWSGMVPDLSGGVYGGTNFHAVGLISAAVFGMGGSFIALWISKWMAKRMMGVQVFDASVNDAKYKWIYRTVEHQAREAHIAMPEVGVFQSHSPNAFATGSSRKNSLVAVSTGLLDSMSEHEVEAVLAHEVAHVANGDMVTMALIKGIVDTFVIILARVAGTFIDRVVFRNESGLGMGYFIGYIVSSIVLTIMATPIIMWFSRKREFKADAGAAYLVGKEKMIAALERLKLATSREQVEALPEEMAAFGIVNKSAWSRLFSSHPPIEDRIAALRKL